MATLYPQDSGLSISDVNDKGRKTMKFARLVLIGKAALVAAAVVAGAIFPTVATSATLPTMYDGVQVTYRGRLMLNAAQAGSQTVPTTFRLYVNRDDKEAVWTSGSMDIPVDDQGLFQVALRGEGLAAALEAGAQWIGVTIEGSDESWVGSTDGGFREQYPRQELLAAPVAGQVPVAERLIASPHIVTAAVDRASIDSLALAGKVSVSGNVLIPSKGGMMNMKVNVQPTGMTLPVKGKVKLFSRSAPQYIGTGTVGLTGGVFFNNYMKAPCNCAAFFTSTNNDSVPGMTLFFKKGEYINVSHKFGLPADTIVSCWIYPIGVE